MTEFLPPLLWAIGWFVTIALGAALMLARFGTLNPREWSGDESSHDFGWIMIATIIPIMLGLLWPIALAYLIGWLLWPLMKKLLAARAALERSK